MGVQVCRCSLYRLCKPSMSRQPCSRMPHGTKIMLTCGEVQDLSVGLLSNMYKDKVDFTTTFRSLASVSADDQAGSIPAPLAKVQTPCWSPARPSQGSWHAGPASMASQGRGP